MTNTNPEQHLLIVWHSRTGAARQLAQAALEGAQAVLQELEASDRVGIVLRTAQDTTEDDLLNAAAYLFCAPENLASLSGAMKECFDRNYYGVLDRISGRPYALAISAGSDGSGAVRQAERICTGWRLRAVAPAYIANTDAQTPEAILAEKKLTDSQLEPARTLGGTLAALIA
ncbi:flavodoxin family protein [Achromobacter sp. F4_2707]|uniref:flavodoxin family protein n=1 Tax=Achromobacter sp. F4_2707 TaxID=3114286 RepID=UPI0039C752FB